MIIRIIYVFLIGAFIAIFIGVGINTFYKGPTMPQYPPALQIDRNQYISESLFLQLVQEQTKYDQQMQKYVDELSTYNRNVAIISMAYAIVILVLSLTVVFRLAFLADGFLLGGLFTLIYSIIREFGSNNNILEFALISCGLIIILILGYIKIIPKDKQFLSILQSAMGS